MGFSKTVKIALVVTALAATAAVSSIVGCKNDSPNTAVPPTTIEDTVSPTDNATTTPEEQYATLKWVASSPDLAYNKGETSWEANVAEDIEKTLLSMTNGNLSKTPEDFFMGGVVVDEKDRYVVAWGNVDGSIYSKVSFRNLETGVEESSYWLDKAHMENMLVLYDVPTENGLKDYIVIVGETFLDKLLHKAIEETGLLANELPLIEVRQLTDNGSVSVSYNPLVYLDGTATGVNVIRDEAGKVTFDIEARTRADPDGRVYSVALTDLLELKKEAPVFDWR